MYTQIEIVLIANQAVLALCPIPHSIKGYKQCGNSGKFCRPIFGNIDKCPCSLYDFEPTGRAFWNYIQSQELGDCVLPYEGR